MRLVMCLMLIFGFVATAEAQSEIIQFRQLVAAKQLREIRFVQGDWAYRLRISLTDERILIDAIQNPQFVGVQDVGDLLEKTFTGKYDSTVFMVVCGNIFWDEDCDKISPTDGTGDRSGKSITLQDRARFMEIIRGAISALK